MKTILTASSFLLLVILSVVVAPFDAIAQDANLPQGNSRIYLHSGKEIKRVRLWKIDDSKVEYVLDGNLGDVRTSDVKKIETPYYLITFDEGNKMLQRHYDLILPYSGDTIWCFIQKADESAISYLPVGSETQKTIVTSSVKTYLQWPGQKPVLETNKTVPAKDSVNTLGMSVDSTHKSTAADSANKMQKTISADATHDDYYVSGKKAEEDVAQWQYYHQSYQRGVSDAEATSKTGGWGVGGFCLGASGCFPILSLSAINSNVYVNKIPPGVDKKLYEDGYRNQTKQKRVKAASSGALVAYGIFAVIMIIALTYSY